MKGDGEYTVKVKITNTGNVPGKEVVQLYYRTPYSSVERPALQLASFSKTRLLAPGASEEVYLRFNDRDISWFDADRSAWVLEGTEYVLEVGASSQDIKGRVSLKTGKDKVLETVHKVLLPSEN